MPVDIRTPDPVNDQWVSRATGATFPLGAAPDPATTSLDKDFYNMGDTALLTINYSGTAPTINDGSGHMWTKQSDTGTTATYSTVV